MPNEILTPKEMRLIDERAATCYGIGMLQLMENAGRAVTAVIQQRFKKCKVAVLCGPGNNGGDGLVVAQLLKRAKWPVEVFLFSDNTFEGVAQVMRERWKGPVKPLTALGKADLIVDALFGAGLSRDFPPELAARVNGSGAPVIAVDVPSGLDGLAGMPRGASVKADVTVTFFRKKPAHVLYPGRALCGDIVVADIGICDADLDVLAVQLFENVPPRLPTLEADAHKFSRGATLIYSGGKLNTGAARLAAIAAARSGAGVVNLCGSPEALAVHAAHVTSIMLKPCEDVADLNELLADRRVKVFCIGPAAGVNDQTRDLVLCALGSGVAVVLDADALSCFSGAPEELFGLIFKSKAPAVVMTPHEGEFARLFPNLSGSKIDRVRAAAKRSSAVVLLKGPDTVIAHPDGRAIVNTNGSPKLATAGSGDVLAGLITGLLAQGMAGLEAAAASAWLHADAANRSPRRTLMAEDLLEVL